MVLRILEGDSGQTNIDFLFGVSVFLLTFIYAATFIPGLFVPYQSGGIDLSSVAYRTSTMLVEDPGWYGFQDAAQNWTGNIFWEKHPNAIGIRIGLADDKAHPNILSIDKIKALNSLAVSNYSQVVNGIGLNGTIQYNVSMDLTRTDANPAQHLLTATWPTPSSTNVESIERNVLVDNGKAMFVDNGLDPNPSNHSNMLSVNLNNTSAITSNVIIRISNTTGSITATTWSADNTNVTPMNTWVYGTNYSYYVNGTFSPTDQITITNKDEVVELVITAASFTFTNGNVDQRYIWITGNNGMFPFCSVGAGGKTYNYYTDPLYRLKAECYPAKLTLKVWSDDFA